MNRPSAEPADPVAGVRSSPRRGLGRSVGVVYLALLALSWAYRWTHTSEPPLPRDLKAVELAAVAVDDDGLRVLPGERVRLAWREWPAADPGAGDAPAVVLLHGSPGDSHQVMGLGALLARDGHRVLAPDLPGFGGSSRRVPDYSIRAHADYVARWLGKLGLGRVHLIGFSMGGGVALRLAESDPERVVSLVLLSSIGAQEHELLGRYLLNHALHALQWLAVVAVDLGVPHFGSFDDFFFGIPYARNFLDTDQRPLRGILGRLGMPVLVAHGRRDPLVPFSAAAEHHRLVPQSELVVFESDHFIVFRHPERLVPPIGDFFRRAERGVATTRATADPGRVAEARRSPGPLPRVSGLSLAVWVALLALATLVSEDLTCLGAGLLVAQARLGFAAAVLGCAAGIFVGDLLLYFGGRLGRPWLHRVPLKWIVEPRDVARSSRWFRRRGALVIFFSRFLPGSRIPTYVTAGILHLPALWFATCLLLPILVWVPILVGLAWLFGDRLFQSFDLFQRYALPGFLAILVLAWSGLVFGRALFTARGRRRLVGLWKRWTCWEFWPPWAFYPPVVLYVLWLGLRHRGLTLFTAANPGIPAGGFVGESKSEILDRLDPSRLARFRRLPGDWTPERKIGEVDAFRADLGLDYPVVLKPDRGERGRGVVIARSEDDVEAFCCHAAGDAIVQEYIGGPELGVFYVRLPGDDRGRIFAITDKRLPAVTGDGLSSLEDLVLRDSRAVAMADFYLRTLGARRDDVPAAGERVRLVELGTHCRGAVFLDGEPFRTPELEDAVDRLSRSFDGFYFGRYDLRAPTLEAFREGRDFRVLELNGVTSEATGIYDPKHSLWDAYRILFEQWRLAFEIGSRNRDRGVRPAGVREIVRSLLDLRRRRRSSAGW